MKNSLAAAAAFVAGTLAIPTTVQERATSPIYGPSHHVIDSICPAPTAAPLLGTLPLADLLGSVIAPPLHALIGDNTVELIDNIAGFLCVSTVNDPSVCRTIFSYIRSFVDAKTPLGQSHQFGCLLDYLCVAHGNPTDPGTCARLMTTADCFANRIIGTKDLECTPE